MESGSALCSWAYNDNDPAYHGRRIAEKVGCISSPDDDEAIVRCLQGRDYTAIMLAGQEYKLEQEASGSLGFDGMSPCGQTAGGDRRVFRHGDNMLGIMASGDYAAVPVLAGANRDEGLLQIGSEYVPKSGQVQSLAPVVFHCWN